MKQIVSVFALLMVTAAVFISCSGPPKPIPEEEELMSALQKVQDGVEAKVSYEKFDKLLSAARQKLDALKSIEEKNACYFNAVDKCYASFSIGQKAWKLKEEAENEKRRIDMDTTLSFSLGFASVSLAKAGECFKRK